MELLGGTMNNNDEQVFRKQYQKLSDNDMVDGCIFNKDEDNNCEPTIEECEDCDTFEEFVSNQ